MFSELDSLRSQLHAVSSVPHQSSVGTDSSVGGQMDAFSSELTPAPNTATGSWMAPSNPLQGPSPTTFTQSQIQTSTSPATVGSFHPFPAATGKRKRSHFEIQPVSAPDFVSTGLVSVEDAEQYFNTFFQGCHQYVPIFDPQFDSIESIRSRSGVLFSTICATGCRILRGSDSNSWHQLNFHLKILLNAVIGTSDRSLEVIQALLVRACYVSERSLLVTLAARLAIEAGLPEAYDEMSTSYLPLSSGSGSNLADEENMLRKTRTWLHLLNLGHILHVDAGDLLTFKFRGDVRRVRVLLESSLSTDLDLHLISQVELNVLRASSQASLSNHCSHSDDEIMEVVRDAQIDIDVWFNDWLRIFERAPSQQKRWLSQQLRIQRCWAVTMALCRSVRVSGIENVDAMSPTQRHILRMAKGALKQHLQIIIEEPRDYLRNLRFAMDFLSMLLGDEDEAASRRLIGVGQILLAELQASSGNGNGSGSGSGSGNGGGAARSGQRSRANTGRVYLQLLQTGIEKFSRTVLHENVALHTTDTGANTPTSGGAQQQQQQPPRAPGDHNELESFVPEQFVFEWDFPGLTLFSSPTTDAGWLDDFLRSSLIGGEDLFGLPWNSEEGDS
ncbi:hypothetical protein GMORB2_4637 [Geosmithia morbida]|uniref:Transcription factor domain-containing protein n=1 Tax=Geosmithia morbida TaxID=1094350 RepID=A0A9P5CYK8_9HYPO|nr:uncharacterized protein GMORB2_4637 [Geosmithia morbida]KAF4119507.1 hypothetical protein GMORB2_4637 [Geosmithia morbida]